VEPVLETEEPVLELVAPLTDVPLDVTADPVLDVLEAVELYDEVRGTDVVSLEEVPLDDVDDERLADVLEPAVYVFDIPLDEPEFPIPLGTLLDMPWPLFPLAP